MQAQVRMWLARTRFRRTTELGRKAAVRAAKQAERENAALVLQKYARRRIACKLVRICSWRLACPAGNSCLWVRHGISVRPGWENNSKFQKLKAPRS